MEVHSHCGVRPQGRTMVESLNNQSTEGYIIRHISVSCPECHCGFSAPSLVDLPAVTEYDTIEADLHRALPDAELRGVLIAVCPHCNFATWTVRFKASSLNPEMLPDAVDVPATKKFALAVKHAREKGVSPLDIAFIALNGLYCAREAGEDSDLWLELAAYEQNRGIAEESLIPATGQDHLIMGELWRQLGSFENAIASYQAAYGDDAVPQEVLDQQIKLAQQGVTSRTILPPYVVRDMFPQAQELAERLPVGKNGRPVPPCIERRPKPERLEMVNFGPPERRTPLSSAVPDEPLPAGLEEESKEVEAIELAVDGPVAVPAQTPVVAPAAAAATVAPAAAAPAAAAPVAKQEEAMSVAKVRQIIAQPAGASAIYLVQAAQVPQLDAPNSGGRAKGGKGKAAKKKSQEQDPLPKIDMPTNEYFDGASSPSNNPKENAKVSPMQKALNKAMRKEKEEGDRFPEIQLTDDYAEEEYQATYASYQYAQEQVDEDLGGNGAGAQQQPAASAQGGNAGGGDITNAVAAVESFLNLRRQPSYQNWIRSYKQ